MTRTIFTMMALLLCIAVLAAESDTCDETCQQSKYGMQIDQSWGRLEGDTLVITGDAPDMSKLSGVSKLTVKQGATLTQPHNLKILIELEEGAKVEMYPANAITNSGGTVTIDGPKVTNGGRTLDLGQYTGADVETLANGQFRINGNIVDGQDIKMTPDALTVDGIRINGFSEISSGSIKHAGDELYIVHRDNHIQINGDLTGNEITADKDGKVTISGEVTAKVTPLFATGAAISGKNIEIDPKTRSVTADSLSAGSTFSGVTFDQDTLATDSKRLTLTSNKDSVTVSDFHCSEGQCISHASTQMKSGQSKSNPSAIPSVTFEKEDQGWKVTSDGARTYQDNDNRRILSDQDTGAVFHIKDDRSITSIDTIDGKTAFIQERILKERQDGAVTEGAITRSFDRTDAGKKVTVSFDKDFAAPQGSNSVIFDGNDIQVTGDKDAFSHSAISTANGGKQNRYMYDENGVKSDWSKKLPLIAGGDMIVTGNHELTDDPTNAPKISSSMQYGESTDMDAALQDFTYKIKTTYGLSDAKADEVVRSCISDQSCRETAYGYETEGIKATTLYSKMHFEEFQTTIKQSTFATDTDKEAKEAYSNYLKTSNALLGTDIDPSLSENLQDGTRQSFLGIKTGENYNHRATFDIERQITESWSGDTSQITITQPVSEDTSPDNPSPADPKTTLGTKADEEVKSKSQTKPLNDEKFSTAKTYANSEANDEYYDQLAQKIIDDYQGDDGPAEKEQVKIWLKNPENAAKYQESIGATPDGMIGPKTVEAYDKRDSSVKPPMPPAVTATPPRKDPGRSLVYNNEKGEQSSMEVNIGDTIMVTLHETWELKSGRTKNGWRIVPIKVGENGYINEDSTTVFPDNYFSNDNVRISKITFPENRWEQIKQVASTVLTYSIGDLINDATGALSDKEPSADPPAGE
jgi:hypothetical protein